MVATNPGNNRGLVYNSLFFSNWPSMTAAKHKYILFTLDQSRWGRRGAWSGRPRPWRRPPSWTCWRSSRSWRWKLETIIFVPGAHLTSFVSNNYFDFFPTMLSNGPAHFRLDRWVQPIYILLYKSAQWWAEWCLFSRSPSIRFFCTSPFQSHLGGSKLFYHSNWAK